MLITRRAALTVLGATLPRFAVAQADTRPTITVAVRRIVNSNTLDVLNENSNVGSRHFNLYQEPLIDTDWTGNLSLRPGLAQSWRRIDDRTIDFVLRPGVRFHNNDELTAEDISWGFGERLFGGEVERTASPGKPRDPRWATPKVRANARNAFPALERIEVTGRHTFRWVNRVPDMTLEGRLAMQLGSILNARSGQAATNWYEWARRPVGTGPYRVVEYRAERDLVLEAFDEYWGGRPPIRRIRFLEVPELSSRVNGLLTGEYDFACDLTPDQIPIVARSARHEVVGGEINNIRVLFFDQHHPQLVNPRMRRALTHAIDRQAIVDSIWDGLISVPKGLQFPSYGAMYLPEWSPPNFDPALARSLAAEVGYKGDPIPFRVANNYYTSQVATAQVLSEMFKAAGLNVVLEMKENMAQVLAESPGRAINDQSESAIFNDPVSFRPSEYGDNGDYARAGYYANAEVAQMMELLQTSVDLTTRRRAVSRALAILEREDPAMTVLHRTANFTAKRRAVAWKASGSFVMDFRTANFALLNAG